MFVCTGQPCVLQRGPANAAAITRLSLTKQGEVHATPTILGTTLKKLLVICGAIAVAALAANPAHASASTGYLSCSIGKNPYTYTNGGHTVSLTQYRGRGMACSSVRYVANNWLRPKISRQYGWPRLSRPFYDGYVTWHCWKLSRSQV